MDLRERLDQAIDDGPPLPPPERRLEAGRAAVRRRHVRATVGATSALVGVAVTMAMLVGSPGSSPAELRPAASASPTAQVSVPDDEAAGRARKFRIVVIDGVPQVAGQPAGLSIGPVVRGDERAFGLDTEVLGERSFVLVVRSGDGWQLRRLVAAHPGQDLATWLRGHGWLPTGESP